MAEGFLARFGAIFSAVAALAFTMGSCAGKSGESGGSGGQGAGGSGSGGSCSVCPAVNCAAGMVEVTSQGTCPCPTCVPSACANVRCTAPTCANGATPVVPAGECCPVCPDGPNCAAVDCIDVMCPAGQHAEVPDGECCPQCISDDPCEAGRMRYDAYYERRTTELDAFSCNENEGCWLVPSFICRPGCGVAVSYSSSSLLQVELSGYAAQNCLMCPDVIVTCPAMQTAVCVNGVCTLSPE